MKNFVDYTENEMLTLICKAIDEMRTEKTKLLGQQDSTGNCDYDNIPNISKAWEEKKRTIGTIGHQAYTMANVNAPYDVDFT